MELMVKEYTVPNISIILLISIRKSGIAEALNLLQKSPKK